MTGSVGDNGFDPRVPAECRAFLRAALDAGGAPASASHASECSHCARRIAMHRRLAASLAVRPPKELRAPSFLSAIHERVIEACEATVLGEIVAGNPPAPPAVVEWSEGLLSSPLAEDVVAAPPSPPGVVWARVRQTILVEVRATPARRWRTHLWLGAAGVAATLIVSTLLREGASPSPNIVFVDFPTRPNVDIADVAIWRSGDVR